MAIVQSDWAKGRRVAPDACAAGEVIVQRFTFKVTANLAANDIIELAVLPAMSTPVDAILYTGNLGAGVTVDVGIMSGTVGDPSASRTCGAELFDDAANNAVVRPSAATAFTIASTESDRSVGVKVSGAVTASSQDVWLELFYTR